MAICCKINQIYKNVVLYNTNIFIQFQRLLTGNKFGAKAFQSLINDISIIFYKNIINKLCLILI